MTSEAKNEIRELGRGWLLDCGNTAIKLCYAEGGKLGRKLAMARRSYESDRFLAVQQLRQATAGYPPADWLVAALGREEDRPLLGELQPFLLPGRTALIVSPVFLRSMKVHYREGVPGADRIANAFGARSLFPGRPVAAVDFGTATNIAVVDALGDFVGGTIMAGATVQLEALHRSTAGRLPEIVLKGAPPLESVLGQSTTSAMLAGALVGTAGAVDRMLQEIEKSFAEEKMAVVVTGGHYPLLKPWLRSPHEVDEHLTFRGLLEYQKKEKN